MDRPPADPGVPTLVAARRITVLRDGAAVLDGVDFAVNPGEIVTLIGPNGSGKTTLVHALLGLARVARGTVTRRPGLRIGYVPQSFVRDRALPLTVTRFLSVFGAPDQDEIPPTLAEVGAAALAERQLASLSGGEFARVALARALLGRPELLVLDEPMGAVDVTGEAALYELIAAARAQSGCGVLLVSHDLHVVMAAADRVVCLNRHVCCEGEARAVVRDPAFVRLFGPRVAEQLALYAHRHDHAHAPSGDVVALEHAPHRQADGHG